MGPDAPLALEEAQARLLALAQPLDIERVAVDETQGRYLAEPLLARRTQPAADLSAMDGFSIHASDVTGPWRIIGESAAGHPFAGRVGAGEAVRIATGALIPDSSNCVLLQEDCARQGEWLHLTGTAPAPSSRHIRRAGSDFQLGRQLLPQGSRIGPVQIALAIAAGHTHLPVHRCPRLAIIDSGDELAAWGENCPRHQIPASNGAMLTALAGNLPCQVQHLGPVADRLDDLVATLEAALGAGSNDVIVTSGGASVGDHDLIRPALERIGARLAFWRVAIKPGKPLLVATRGRQTILGLPGNPVSTLVTGYFFLLPLLRRLLGAEVCLPRPVRTRLVGGSPPGGARREFRHGVWDGIGVRDGAIQDSGVLASLAASNCLIDRPAGAPPGAIGDEVTIYLLENGGIA